jgi:hypothetical protein
MSCDAPPNLFVEWQRLVNFWMIANDAGGRFTLDDIPQSIPIFVEWLVGTNPQVMADWLLLLLADDVRP